MKSKILELWTTENQTKKNIIEAQKKIDDLTAGKIKFAALNPTSYPSIGRKGDDKIAKDVMGRILNAETGKYILAISTEKNGIYISRINSVTLPKEVKGDKETQDGLIADIANVNFMSYMESLQTKYPVRINDELIKRVYDRKDTSNE